MKTILSIDFDFFVKEDSDLDIGHGDSRLFNETLWAIRETQWKAQGKTVREILPMVGHPVGLAHYIMKRFLHRPDANGASSESHAAIVDYLDKYHPVGSVEIINFDAHHDICYKDPVAEFHGEKVDCGNWVLHLLLAGRLSKYTIIYPDWRKEKNHGEDDGIFIKLPMPLRKLIEVTYRSEWRRGKSKRIIDGMFLCRSGPWVPPCYDKEFNILCRLLTGSNALKMPERNCVLPEASIVK